MKDPTPGLLYHKVTPRWEAGVTWVTPGQFRRQMSRLKQAGWDTLRFDQPVANTKQFVLAFDDGYECLRDHALPVLNGLGYRAMTFIPTGYIGRLNDWDHQFYGRKFRHLDQAGLRVLCQAGWVIGSHGVGHLDLTSLSESQLKSELSKSKRALEDILVEAVEWISFPFGRYNDRVIEAVVETGYKGMIGLDQLGVVVPPNLRFIEVNAVYLWDSASLLPGRLEQRGFNYRTGRAFRRCINALSGGTRMWRSLFPPSQS